MSLSSSLKLIAALVLALVVSAVGLVAIFGWNWLRGPIERRVTERTGRIFAIKGDLTVKLGWPSPHLQAAAVSFANPSWAREKQMLTADSVDITFDGLQLLRRHIVLPQVHLQRPVIYLEQTADGRKNWLLDMKHSGALVFVRVRHEVSRKGETRPALTEFHDIVYRDVPRPGDAVPASEPAPADAAWVKDGIPDDVLLFRYSALTFNGHRIHYDRRYVTEVEGYPGLIVHGPLIATLLLDLLRRELPEAQVARYEFRAVRPTFDTAPFQVCGMPHVDGKTVRLWARDHEGGLTMNATATLRQPQER